MLKLIRILGFVAALAFVAPVAVPVTAQACGGESCAMCEGKASADHAEKSKVASKTTKSGRKLKCSKCADHSEAKAGTADASAPAAAEAKAPAT